MSMKRLSLAWFNSAIVNFCTMVATSSSSVNRAATANKLSRNVVLTSTMRLFSKGGAKFFFTLFNTGAFSRAYHMLA